MKQIKMRKKTALKNYSKSDLIYNSNHTFHRYYCDIKNFDVSLESKYSSLAELRQI